MPFSMRTIAVLVAAVSMLTALPQAGLAQDAETIAPRVVLRDHPQAYRRVTSPAGRPYWFRHDEITPYAALSADLTFDDGLQGREGVRQLIGNAIFQTVDPDGRSDYRERFADIHGGGSLTVSDRGALIQARAPGALLGEALDLVLTLVGSGTPTLAAIERVRTNAIAADKQAAFGAVSAADRAGKTLLLGDHRLVRAFDGARFDRFGATDIDLWRMAAIRRVAPDIVVSGRISEADAGTVIDQAFGAWPLGERASRSGQALVAARSGSVRITAGGRQVAVRFQAPTRSLTGRDRVVAAMAVQILGGGDRSRLWEAIRGSLGASYGANAGLQEVSDEQMLLGFGAAVDPQKAVASIAALRDAYTRWQTAGVTQAEFDAFRSRSITAFLSSFRDPSQANAMVTGLLRQGRPVDELDRHLEHLRGLTVGDVNALIGKTFPKAEALLLSIAAPAGAEIPTDCIAESWTTVAATCRF